MPERVTLVLDSTVAVRYGAKEVGAEKGYNPQKRGRPSHHPLIATLAKCFFGQAMVEYLQGLSVTFLLKVPDHHWVRGALGPMRLSRKSLEVTKDPAVAIWSAGGLLYETRLLSLEWRRTEDAG